MGVESCAAAEFIGAILASFGTYDKAFTLTKHPTPANEQPSVVSDQRVDYLTFDQVNPAYGVIRKRGYREMDAWLLDAVEAAEQALEELPPEERTWKEVINAFQQCPLLAVVPHATIDRAEEFVINRSNWFKKQAHYGSVADEVQRWFTQFLNDMDIEMARRDVDIKAIYDVVAHAGRLFDGNVVFKKERQKRTLLDIGVLRYPDLRSPYIKVYRIELVAWYESTTILGRAQDRNGIMAQFNLRKYEPDKEATRELRETLLRNAVQDYAIATASRQANA